MKFQKGRAKTGGRVKASSSSKSKELIKDYIENNFAKYVQKMELLDDFQGLQMFMRLLSYHVPKPTDNIKYDFTQMSEEDKQEFINKVAEQMRELNN